MASPQSGIPVLASTIPMQPGQVVISYETVPVLTGCCKCSTLTGLGTTLMVIGILLFAPLACIVCCMPSMHTVHQRPVYGYPGQAPMVMAMAMPVMMQQQQPQYQQQPQMQQAYVQQQQQVAPSPEYAPPPYEGQPQTLPGQMVGQEGK